MRRYTPRVQTFFHRLRTRLANILRRPEPASFEPTTFDVPVTDRTEPETVFAIRSGTVVRVALIVLVVVVGFQLAAQVADALLLIVVALIIAAAAIPPVDALVRRGWPRTAATSLLFVIGIGVVTAIVVMLVPVLADELIDLAQNTRSLVEALVREGPQTLPVIGPSLARFTQNIDPEVLASELQQPLQELGKSLLSLTAGAAGAAGKLAIALFDLVGVVVISFYMVLRRSMLEGLTARLTPRGYRARALRLHGRILTRMGAWLRAQLLVMFFAFILSWIGFEIIGLKYALALSILAGVFSIVPVVGWFSAGILAALIALTQSVWVFLGALIVILVVHFFEAYIFIPLVTERAVGLSPVSVLIVLLLGAKLAGLLGVLLAVPITTAFAVLFEDRDEEPAAAP